MNHPIIGALNEAVLELGLCIYDAFTYVEPVSFVNHVDGSEIASIRIKGSNLLVKLYSNDDRGGAEVTLELSDPTLMDRFESLMLQAKEGHEAFSQLVDDLRGSAIGA